MAGAYLTIGAKFRPFSYDELIKPVAASAQLHAQIDEKLGELQEKAGVWENLANKETDHESYIKYKEYADALRAQADDLAKNGLNPQSLRQLMNMKARYSNDIVPIEQAYTRRRQLADEQRKMQLQNPTLKFQRDMSTTSLDDFVKNPELDYGYSVNGAVVAQQAGQAFANLAKTIQQEPQYKHILNDYYWQSMTKAGYSPSQILALSINSDEAPEELKAIAKQVYDSTGVEDFINKNYQDPTSAGAQEWRDYVNSYINQGAWSAVGTTAYGTVADPQKQYEARLEEARAKAGLKANATKTSTIKRNDSHLTGASSENNRHYLGTYDIAGETHANQLTIDKIDAIYAGGKQITTIEGLDKETGALSTGTMSVRDYNKYKDDGLKFSQIQVDYPSGTIIASATVRDGKRNKLIRIAIPYKDVLNESDKAAVKQSLDKWNEMQKAKAGKSTQLTYYKKDGKWYYTNGETSWEADKLEEETKDKIFAAATGFFNYYGAVNQNVEAGQKMNAALDPYNITSTAEADVDIEYDEDE